MAQTSIAAPSPSSGWFGRTIKILLVVFVLVLLMIIAAAIWLGSESGLKFLLDQSKERLEANGGTLITDGARGGLYRGVRFDRLEWSDGKTNVVANDIKARWSLRSLLRREVVVPEILIGDLSVKLPPPEQDAEPRTEPLSFPEDIGLPVSFDLNRFYLKRLVVHQPVTQEGGERAEPIEINEIRFSLNYTDGAYNIIDLSAILPWGKLTESRVSLNDKSPHAVLMRSSFDGAFNAHPMSLKLAVLGNLNGLNASIRGVVNESPVSADVRLKPLAVNPIVSANGWVRKLDLARFEPEWPKSELDIDIDLLNPRALPQVEKPQAKEGDADQTPQPAEPITDTAAWRGRLELTNASSGPLPDKQLPLQSLSADLQLDTSADKQPTRLLLKSIKIGLPGADELANIAGDVQVMLNEEHRVAGVALPTAIAALQFTNIDAAQFVPDVQPTALNGRFDLTRDLFDLNLAQTKAPKNQNTGLPGDGRASVSASGRISDDAIHLDSGSIRLGKTNLSVSGRSSLSAPFDVAIGGKLENVALNTWIPKSVEMPARWRSGNINADWSLNGFVSPKFDAKLSLNLARSRLAGHPLAGDVSGSFKFAPASEDSRVQLKLDDTRIKVQLGSNVISANGSLGATGDVLNISGRLAAPEIIDPRLRGSIGFKGRLSGPLDQLILRMNSSARKIVFAQENQRFQVDDLNIDADLPIVTTVAPSTAVQLSLSAAKLQSEGQQVTGLRLRVNGQASEHRIVIKGKSNGQRVIADGTGSMQFNTRIRGDEPNWVGKITKLQTSGRVNAKLKKPAGLEVSASNVLLSDIAVDIVSGVTRFKRLKVGWAKGVQFSAQGDVKRVPVVALAALGSDAKLPTELDGLVLDSQFDVVGSGAKDLTGKIDVFLTERINQNKPGIGLKGKNWATIKLNKGAVDGRVDMRLPSLVFSRRFTGSDWAVDGSIKFVGRVGGRVDDPKFNGVLTGEDLSLLQPALGWRFSDGTLDARFNGEQVVLRKFRLQSGEGSVELAGKARVVDRKPGAKQNLPMEGRFTLTADRTVVPIGPGQKLVLSGQSAISSSASGLSWTGNMTADEGLIEIAGSGAPSLPSDVQIVDSSKKEDPEDLKKKNQPSDSPQVKTQLNIDLGEKLRVTGGGVDAFLTGKLSLHGNLPDRPRVTGDVLIKNGSYFAYGQELIIKRGVTRFTGAIDNPVLDITAIRPELPVEVGVSLGGTALSPIVKLVSVPVLSDAETLSWLVLGTPLDNAQAGAQSLALKQAAAALIGSDGTGGGLASIVGLDSLGLGYASDTDQQVAISDSGSPTGLPGSTSTSSVKADQEVVTLGKKLSKRLSVSYEQGVRGVWNLLRIQYEISNRLSLRAQTGSESAVDLIYFFSFD